MRRRSRLFVLPVVAAVLAIAFAAPVRAQVSTTYFLGVPYGHRPPSDPLYEENLFDLFYPAGACPLGPGCSNQAYPVAVYIRGGNANSPPLTAPDQVGTLCQAMLDQGFIVAMPNFHEIDVAAGEDFLPAARDLGRMVQYLRRFHTILNTDPDRVFTIGRSGGGFYSYYLGLNRDYQDPRSPDLVERESSRPDFIVPMQAVTDWECMDLHNPATNPALLQMFQATDAVDAPMLASPTYWLQNPDLYGRSVTPPMCMAYDLSSPSECGSITNFHDGYFGTRMQQVLTRGCGGWAQGSALCSQSTMIGAADDSDMLIQLVVEWMVERASS